MKKKEKSNVRERERELSEISGLSEEREYNFLVLNERVFSFFFYYFI